MVEFHLTTTLLDAINKENHNDPKQQHGEVATG